MTRRAGLSTTLIAALGAATPAFFHPQPRLIWNVSPSAPIGLYIVQPVDKIHVAELVAVRPPVALAWFLVGRHYLPAGAPMLKRVLALPGQIVCRKKRTITVDGIAVGEALDNDTRGRPLPAWQGCQRIAMGEVFLMNRHSEISFDGRYFGPLPVTSVIGRAVPLWTSED
jgi:conjugative transfer signal peptidase TraF